MKALFSAFLLLLNLTIAVSVQSQEVSEVIELPSPDHSGKVSLGESIFRRRSTRSFSDDSLSKGELSQLLWAAEGKTVDAVTGPSRAAPSAGGIYPLEILVVAGRVDGLRSGVYRYEWKDHALEMLIVGDLRSDLSRSALNQRFIAQAPVTIVIAADYRKTTRVYGERGRMRYVPMDAGHVAQNVCLQSTALGLGTVPVGAFRDDEITAILRLDDAEPLYLLPAGRPR